MLTAQTGKFLCRQLGRYRTRVAFRGLLIGRFPDLAQGAFRAARLPYARRRTRQCGPSGVPTDCDCLAILKNSIDSSRTLSTDLDPYLAAIDHLYMLAGRPLHPVRRHYAADTWHGKSRRRATRPLK